MEIRKISRRRPRSVDDAELGHFTLQFCRGRQINVQRFITHVHSYCFVLAFFNRYPWIENANKTSWIIVCQDHICSYDWGLVHTTSFWVCVWGKLGKGNRMIIVAPSLSKSYVLQMVSGPENTKLVFANSSGLKSDFENLRFRDGILWTVGQTVVVKLRHRVNAPWKCWFKDNLNSLRIRLFDWLNHYLTYRLFDSHVFKASELFNLVSAGVEPLVSGILGLEIFAIFFVLQFHVQLN